MYCSKCGTQNNQGEKFCKNCGTLLVNEQSQIVQPDIINQQYSQSNNGLTESYIEKAVNPNMKIWAILSIIVPIVAIIWYVFIGLSFYIAIFITGVGYGFAQKGEMADKKLAKIGKILNGILCGLAIVMLIINFIAALA